jgi:hypothetical protein
MNKITIELTARELQLVRAAILNRADSLQCNDFASHRMGELNKIYETFCNAGEAFPKVVKTSARQHFEHFGHNNY